MKVLKSYKRMAPELQLYLQENVKPVIVRKNDTIQKKGAFCDHIYFIENGVVRGFVHERRSQRTVWFKKENEFIISLQKIINKPRKPITVIEALEDCLFLGISSGSDRLLNKASHRIQSPSVDHDDERYTQDGRSLRIESY